MIRLYFLILLSAMLLMIMGCSAQHNVVLSYDKSLNLSGGSGEITIAKPMILQSFKKNSSGQILLGDYWDAVTWDIVTDSNISDWIANALGQELKSAGYKVNYVNEITTETTKGLTVTLLKFAIVGARKPIIHSLDTNMLLSLKLWKDGRMVKEYFIEGNGENAGWTPNMAKKAGQSIEVAFNYCIKEMMIKIIDQFK